MSIIRNSILKLLAFTALTLTAFFMFSVTTFAATITVDTLIPYIGDGGCGLLEAIENANNDDDANADCLPGFGIDTIEFNIGVTNDTSVITDTDALYSITSPIIFNGLSQGNATCGIAADLSDRDLDIQLDGIELEFSTGSDGSSIAGLSVMGGETYAAINIRDIDGFDLTCSNVGIDASGTSANATRNTLLGVYNADNVTIGDIGLAVGNTNIFAGGNENSVSESISLGEVNNFSAYGNWFGKGVGPSFNEFPATQDYVELCGPTSCGGGGPRSSNLVFEGNDVTVGGAENSFSLNGADTLVLENNDFEDSLEVSIGIQDSTNVTVLGNNISGGEFGIDMYDSSVSVTIESNDIENVRETGIKVDSSSNITLRSNTISGADLIGVTIEYSDEVAVLDNNISDNGYIGLVLSNTDDVTLLNNLLSGNGGFGLGLQIVTAGIVQGNYIGTDATGMFANSNGFSLLDGGGEVGLAMMGVSDILIGGDQPSERNIISGNDHEEAGGAIAIFPNLDTFAPSENVRIQGNYIGVAADGVTSLANNRTAIMILGATDTIIGGTGVGEGNIINGGLSTLTENLPAILFFSIPGPTALEDISILSNSIYDTEGVPIAFAADTVGDFEPDLFYTPNPNDAGDTDKGFNSTVDPRNNLNHLLNYPEFTSYETNTTTTDIEYILDVPAGDYRIEFFQNSVLTDYGEGEIFLTSQDITHAGSGQETFTINLEVEVGDYIAATATERNQATTSTFGATSEFSASATIEAMAEEVTRRRSSSSTASSQAAATQAFNAYYGTTTESSSNNNSSNEGSALGSGQCPANLIVTQNLRQGARDGQYHSYTGGTVEEVALVQQHINRIFAAYFAQAAGPVDGIYGPLTEQGVVRLQETLQDEQGADLGPGGTDGIVGPMTRDAINGSCGEMELSS